jgi:hypothetical protein
MRLDQVYGTVAAFTDEELRAFIRADRTRRSSVERLGDQVFLGWLIRAFDRGPLAEARFRASAAIREAGLPEPHPIRAAATRLLPPLVTLVAVFAAVVAFGAVFVRMLPISPIDRATLGEGWTFIGLGAGALLAALVARSDLRAGTRDPADVFGERLLGVMQAVYSIIAAVAALPLAFIVVVMAVPDLADLASIVVFSAAVILVATGVRVGLRTRALFGVWRPFEDAALAAVAHGRIGDLDEHLLMLPLETAIRTSTVPVGSLQATAT